MPLVAFFFSCLGVESLQHFLGKNIRLIDEVKNRRNRGLHGSSKAADGLYTAIEKLTKRVNIPPEEYFMERIYPIS